MQSSINRIKVLTTELIRESNKIKQLVNEDAIILPLGLSMKEMEKIIIEKTLARHQHHQTLTSESLNMSRSTLWRLMKEHGIE